MAFESVLLAAGCSAVPRGAAFASSPAPYARGGGGGGGVIAYASGTTVVLWPDAFHSGASTALHGHTGKVTAVAYVGDVLVSGSEGPEVIVWAAEAPIVLRDAKRSISCIGGSSDGRLMVVGSIDCNVYIYERSELDEWRSLKTIAHGKPVIAVDLHAHACGETLIAVGAAHATLTLYTLSGAKATLAGHEDWIRDLDFVVDPDSGAVLLASASQDRTVRIWRIVPRRAATAVSVLEAEATALGDGLEVSIDALLIAHEDWVYSAKFNGPRTLLTAGAESAVMVWRLEEAGAVWVVDAQLGLVSQKGSTTATGSVGGFWGAGWADDNVFAWGRTGGLRLWEKVADDFYTPVPGIGGHTKPVVSVAWTEAGYLLSTSTDQTTRLWAMHAPTGRWMEFGRPQIHGYDMVAVAPLAGGGDRFVSAAEEKLARIFEMPMVVADLLSRQSHCTATGSAAEAANIPLLGLSNKAVSGDEAGTHVDVKTEHDDDAGHRTVSKQILSELEGPPTEDHLQRHTLFPETAKLYGHGHVCSALAASHDGRWIATACRAQSAEHAIVRIYDAESKDEITQLEGHALTVTAIRFSPDDKLVMTCSRDRSVCIFDRASGVLRGKLQRAHKRVVQDGCWLSADVFVTASRDGTVAEWSTDCQKLRVADIGAPVTAVAADRAHPDTIYVGTDTGELVTLKGMQILDREQLCAAAINSLDFGHGMLAIGSDDHSLRILRIV